MFSSLHPSDSGEKILQYGKVFTPRRQKANPPGIVPVSQKEGDRQQSYTAATEPQTPLQTPLQPQRALKSVRAGEGIRITEFPNRAEQKPVWLLRLHQSCLFFSLHAGLSGLLQFGLVKGAFSFWRLKPFWNKQKAP